MNVEVSLAQRAVAHAALGDPTRLAIVDTLQIGDESPGIIADRLAVSSNLMSHHLNVLQAAGLVTRVRSEADRRRIYLRLNAQALVALQPRVLQYASRVLFVCTHNSARSQLAAALWRSHSDVPVASAGTHPARRIHPRTVAVARRHSLRLGQARPRPLDDVLEESDFVVTVCDSAREELDATLGQGGARVHWSIPDPARSGSDAAFEMAYRTVLDKVQFLLPAVTTPQAHESSTTNKEH